VLNIPVSEMAARPVPTKDELAEVKLTQARYRTEHAGLVAKIRRTLRGKGTR
jgi:hypothetical protein